MHLVLAGNTVSVGVDLIANRLQLDMRRHVEIFDTHGVDVLVVANLGELLVGITMVAVWLGLSPLSLDMAIAIVGPMGGLDLTVAPCSFLLSDSRRLVNVVDEC